MPKKNIGGRPVIYPWHEWFKVGSKHRLKKGRDYTCHTYILAQYIYKRARLGGFKVYIHRQDDLLVLEVLGGIRAKSH